MGLSKKSFSSIAKTFTLILILALLLTLNKKETSVENHKQLLNNIFLHNITRLKVITSQGSWAIQRGFENNFDKWVVEEPLGEPASINEVEATIKNFLQIFSLETINPEELEETQDSFGLIPPEMIATIEGDFGKKVISFGKLTLGEKRYVQVEGENSIHLVPDSFFKNLIKGSDQLRERRPFQFDHKKLEKIVIFRENSSNLNFERKQGIWMIVKDGKYIEADSEFLEQELEKLSNFEVKKFIGDVGIQLPLYGFINPKLVFTLNFEGGKSLILQVGQGLGINPGEDKETIASASVVHYVRSLESPWVYESKGLFFRNWLQPAAHFRDRKPFIKITENDLTSVQKISNGKIGNEIKLSGENFKKLINFLNKLEILSYQELIGANYQKYLSNDADGIKLLFPGSNVYAAVIIGYKVDSSEKKDNFQESPYYAAFHTVDGEDLLAILRAADIKELRSILQIL